MFQNQTHIIEKIKFKETTKTRLGYLGIFIVWLTSYFMILKIENIKSDAYIFFAFGLIFTLISLIAMWKIPNNRDKIIKFFKLGLLAVSLYSILIDILLLCGSFGRDVGTSTMIIKNIGFYSRIVIPLGLIIWQAKQFAFLTGIHKTKEQTINYYKKHGNDGIN